MLARHAFLPALLIITILSSVAPTTSRGPTSDRETDCRDSAFTLDVEIQSNYPGRVIAGFQRRGIELVGVTSQQEHSRTHTHVFVGRFRSVEAAGRYGDSLVTRS